jgi:hypothetical protein
MINYLRPGLPSQDRFNLHPRAPCSPITTAEYLGINQQVKFGKTLSLAPSIFHRRLGSVCDTQSKKFSFQNAAEMTVAEMQCAAPHSF